MPAQPVCSKSLYGPQDPSDPVHPSARSLSHSFSATLFPHNTMSSPATSNYAVESAVIKAPLTAVWHLIKLGDFSKWWSALQSSGPASAGISNEADVCVRSLCCFSSRSC